MILISIHKESKQPLFEQISEQLKNMADSGVLQPGEKLPSTRKLAETLGVNRTTVYRAYEELWAAGYIESVTGGYSRIRRRKLPLGKEAEGGCNVFKWDDCLSEAVLSIEEGDLNLSASGINEINFRMLSPDSDLIPVDDFRRCVNQLIQTEGGTMLQYGDPAGYQPLRAYLARQMQQHGITASADEIVLTNGMQNGIEMVCRLLTNPGDCVFTESPSYASALLLMKYLGLKIVGIPMLADGMDLNELENQFKRQKPKLLYTIPTFHNPTGISTSQAHREKLLALCEEYEVPVVEDGFEEEMKYFGKAVLPVKSMDKKQQTIYLGTFSKVLFPGVRIGWIVAPTALCLKLRQMKQLTDLSGSPLLQAAVFQFCRQGFYELHKKRIHRAYRKRMQVAQAACREFLSADFIRFTKPEGGYLIWLEIGLPVSKERQLADLLVQHGVVLSPGTRFFPESQPKVHFRISIAHRKEDEIREGIKRIGEVIKTFKNADRT